MIGAHNCRSVSPRRRGVGHHALVKGLALTVLLVVLTACAASHQQVASDPLAVLKRAAQRSVATSSATLTGAMFNEGKQVVLMSGAIDFHQHGDSITLKPGPAAGSYPPYEARFVNGWSYVQIDSAVQRPSTVRSGTAWIAFQKWPGNLPVPDRSLPPRFPIDALNLPVTQPKIAAYFVDPTGTVPRRVSVRFLNGEYSESNYTYSIDGRGLIVALALSDPTTGHRLQTFDFTYGPSTPVIVAPTRGVQRLAPGERLYPPKTTAPTSG